MLGLGVQHGGISPTRSAFFRNGRSYRLFLVHQAVDLIRPGAGGDHALIFEVAHLHRGVMPVAVDQRLLCAQQIKHGFVLIFGQLIRILDTQFGLGRL
ncbi:hypothetical protein D3C81_2020620 [compost metagenome]